MHDTIMHVIMIHPCAVSTEKSWYANLHSPRFFVQQNRLFCRTTFWPFEPPLPNCDLFCVIWSFQWLSQVLRYCV